MKETQPTGAENVEVKTPVVPTHGNWVEERGFGQQMSPSSDPQQYDLKLVDPSSSQLPDR